VSQDTAVTNAPSARAEPRRIVFVIDDDDVMLLACRRVLSREGYDVETFASGHEGLARLEQVRPQLLLVDLKMPELDGFQVIERVRQVDPDIIIAVLTGYATIGNAVEAMKAGAYDFLPKPFTPDELRLLVNRGCERWQLAAESARLRREKEEAERRFITFVTHQLKAPAAAAKQYLDVLLFSSRGELAPQTAEWLSRAQARLGEMLDVIDDWLVLSRVERGALCNREASVDLGDIAARIVERTRSQADLAGVAIRADIAAGVRVVGDAASVGTVISNLVSNAVKYNRRGGSVVVRVTRGMPPAATGDQGPVTESAILKVDDTGIGIASESLPRLFREFSRIKCEATEDIPGTGLGLAICQRITSELGGTIEVTSAAGAGSSFTVRLPLAVHGEHVAPA
jgi:signal transduction histidine kinase